MDIEEQNKLKEELVKQQIKAHQEWLKHPVTNDLIIVLKERCDKQIADLMAHILIESNETFESKHRTSINTLKAMIAIITDSTIFVAQQNNNK